MEEEIDEARRAFFQWLDGVHSTQAEEYIQRFENDMALEAVDVANFAMFYYSMAMAHNRRPCKLEEFEAFMKAKEIER
jgi:5-keto 4-deoxyuronate isomerase